MSLTKSERQLRSRIAAHALHAKHDSRELTAAARAKFMQRFLDEVDPNRELPERERLRRAEQKRSEYFARLAFKSAKARRRRANKRAS